MRKTLRTASLLLLILFMPQLLWAKSVTLNLKGADISSVINTVAEATGMNFIVDPRVKGKVTIVSSKPLNSKEIYQVFLAILDVHGYTAVQSGKVTKIIPDADAKHNNAASNGVGEEMVTQVIDVKHISAAQLVPILRPLVPPQGHLAAHAQTNVLIVSDRARNIERIMNIIKRVDAESSSEIEVVPLQHASASEIVRILTNLSRQEKKGEPKSEQPVLVADDRTNTILMGGDKADRLQYKAIIAHLDTPAGSVGNTNVIYLRYAKAKDLVQVLTGVGQIEAKQQGAAGKKATPSARAGGTGDFNIQADESANALVITAPPDIFRSLEAVVKKLDIRRAQVLIEAIIAEVSTSKSSEFGVLWGAWNNDPNFSGDPKPIGFTNFENRFTGTAAAVAQSSKNPQALGSIPLSAGLNLLLGKLSPEGYSFGGIINALAGDAQTNLLSTPNILTMDNEEAEIFVGQEVSVPSGSYASSGSSSTSLNPFTTFKSKQVGIRLKVKPQINEGDAIKLEIDQAVDDITAGTAGEANLVTSQRTIKTSVMVDDGEVVVLGGLIQDNERDRMQKIPFLGDIPILGALFRFKRDDAGKTNLMVFLRPVILRDASLTAAISAGKYRFMQDKQKEAEELKGMLGIFKGNDPPTLKDLEELKKQALPAPPGATSQRKVPAMESDTRAENQRKEKLLQDSYVDAILNE